MKELSIEEKACYYDRAIAKVKEEAIDGYLDAVAVNDIFPELKESEDERIRGAIIDHLKDNNLTEWADWLEKQADKDKLIKELGEYKVKYTQEVLSQQLEKQDENKKPILEFNANDWYASKVDGKIHNTYHSVDKVEPKFKVGDLVKYTNHNKQPIYKINYIDKECYVCTSDDVTLGDKAVMHFAFDNPYLRLVEQQPIDTYCREHCKGYQLIGKCSDGECQAKRDNDKKLQQKTKKTMFDKPAKWNEEDEKFFKTALWHISYSISNGKSTDIRSDTTEWLRNLKERVQFEQKWNEKDKEMIKYFNEVLDYAFKNWSKFGGKATSALEWLELLKDRYTWKPSKEQIKGIECAIKTLQHQLNVGDNRLDSLYDDLKKLREE